MLNANNSPYIHAANEENFRSLVLENSKKGPVLVHFWANKDESSLQQYTILELLVNEMDGRVLLINIDVDAEARICSEYGITSVPGIILFRNEQAVKTLDGYQPVEDLAKLIAPYIARESDKQLANAIEIYADGEPVKAYEIIAEAILKDPINPRLPLAMCKLLKLEGRYHEACSLIESLPEDLRNEREISGFYDLLTFLLEHDPDKQTKGLLKEVESNPADLSLLQQLVVQYVVQQEYEVALKCLLTMMEIDKGYQDNYPLRAMARVFNILGEHHPLTREYRPQLQQNH